MYQFIESLKLIDGVPCNLSFHQERFDRTRIVMRKNDQNINLKDFIKPPVDFKRGIVKCRILYDDIIKKVEYQLYEPRKIKTLKVVAGKGFDYSFKYSDRSTINQLLEKKGDCDDIIIEKNGFLTDTSAGNILFNDGKDWYTPKNCLLPGTCRARLLKEGIIKLRDIRVQDIGMYEKVKIINAMLDFDDGPVVLIKDIY